MLIDDLDESARILIQSRARAAGESLTTLASRYKGRTASELAQELAATEKPDKPGLGLLLAKVALEEAVSARSREQFSDFLFRFGAHLRASLSAPGLTPSQRLALATAAENLFHTLPTSSGPQRAEAAAVRVRLSGPDLHDSDWLSVLGLSREQFDSIMRQFSRELRPRDGERPLRNQVQPQERFGSPRRGSGVSDLPHWLSVEAVGHVDSLVAAGANWDPALYRTDRHSDPELAWTEFVRGNFESARSAVEGVLAQLGEAWGPSSGVDALRTWNWLRLVVELARIERGQASDARRSWTSVCELALRCVPDDHRLDSWLINALGDFVANDPASQRAWCAYTLRLVAAVGHEVALSAYSNSEKATLRQAWQEHFDLDALEAKNTAAATAKLVPLYQRVFQTFYVGARQAQTPSLVVRDGVALRTGWLDEVELAIVRDAQEMFSEAERLTELETTTHHDLSEARRDLNLLSSRIIDSGSALLQDLIAPLVTIACERADGAIARLGEISRPSITVRLASSKLPFSAAEGSAYDIRFIVVNTGNATAEKITLRVSAPEIGLAGSGTLETLGPGASNEIVARIVASGIARRAISLECVMDWTDQLLQSFTMSTSLAAEDQMPVTWSQMDVNPFNLGTISEPERLVGRADDLKSLDALLAGNASAYITGHKRVGKTSLTRVLLREVSQSRGWAGSLLALGRALGPGQSAGDLVISLLDEIQDAVSQAYGIVLDDPTLLAPPDGGNFARVANRWLRSASRKLPAEARVLIAIDDFDELPRHLVEGPQADTLFLFLRSLVDEPWLNLIVVGSEVLPSIIQAQAHKLNQVVPVSVTNFASPTSTAELLETPTATKLEWDVESVDRVHYLCSGNPYYETLLAQRIWLMMREMSRSVVTSADVNEAAVSVANEAPDSHFIHLWADSTSGLDHNARRAIVASAVLRSIARCGGEALVPASAEEVTGLAQRWIQTATTEELNQSIATLKSREVVSSPAEDRLLISIPLVGIWLQSAGARALDSVYADSKHATATVRMITDSDLVSLSKNLRYRGEAISEIRIKAWLEQFGGHDRQYLAYKMLRRMIMDGYFPSTRLQNTALPRLAQAASKLEAARLLVREANNQYYKNAILVNHGVPGDSTQGTLSALAKSLGIKKANIVKTDDLTDRIRSYSGTVVLFLLDDYCGTGTHLGRELDRISENVSSMGEDWVEKVHVVVGASVVADERDLPLGSGVLSVETVGGTYLGDRFRPFSASSGIFDSDDERARAEEMTRSIGSSLLPNNPLGYGGRALLTLFEFNCPNNVAPIFWRGGSVAGSAWTPLFERAV
ncbi:hypothetical protein L332_08925 [Agrococcus pavilionensis RW1]|uniref:Uncharacterized protein n=1 Tax=Agrococcus pavilionensis RW1 TaxID=1330458 RepID=U1LBQ8_9MICO|nr:ATP-binding protein [Agrococcus pavilionensis]ERG64568.1 hypothetical protein L332_08925 [Agrococcus pavilionensis RW1]